MEEKQRAVIKKTYLSNRSQEKQKKKRKYEKLKIQIKLTVIIPNVSRIIIIEMITYTHLKNRILLFDEQKPTTKLNTVYEKHIKCQEHRNIDSKGMNDSMTQITTRR